MADDVTARFTGSAKKVLEMSLREALSLGQNYIGTEHLLLALLREEDGFAARVLAGLDVTIDDVRTETIRQLSSSRPQRHVLEKLTPSDVEQLANLIADALRRRSA